MFSRVTPSIPTVLKMSVPAHNAIVDEVRAVDESLETGGVLLGHNLGQEVLIGAAGGPGDGALHRPTLFHRDTRHATQLASEAWDRDRSQWLGEWHTHPHGSLMPSRLDLATYRSHLQDESLGFDSFIAIQVHSRRDDVLMVAWIVTSRSLERVPIRLGKSARDH